MKGLQRFISGMLAVCLLISMLPASAWATETEPVVETVPETVVSETQETIVIETSETIGTETTEITSETTEASSKNIEAVETSPEITAENVDSPATAAAITASGEWGDNLTWTLNNTGTLTISGTGPMDECWPESSPGWWDFPDQITSLIISEGVTTIGIQAFLNCPYLSSTHIPESVLEIGQHAFASDANLKEIILPAHLSVIGVSAFNHCGLTSITIPSEVSSIGYGAFYGCRELTQIFFTGDAPTIGDMAFYEVTATVYYPENNNTWTTSVMQDYDGDITWIPFTPDTSDSTVIGSGSCGNSLTWTLDDAGVLTISGSGAMYDYYPGDDEHWLSDHVSPERVTSVVFDGNITHLGAYAFSGTSIIDLTIPASITSMDVTALYGIDTLSGIWVEKGNPNFTNDEFGVLYDINKTALIKMPNCFDGEYTIPSGVTFIYGESFCSCPNLTKVTIPDGVETIENSTFSGCSGLREIIIPDSVTSIGFAAFNDCASLETVYYTGTEEEWAAIDIYDAENDALYDAQIYCNYSPVDLTGWRKAYYENIEAYRSAHEDWGNWNESVTYEPIYIDDDTIPELWITYNNYYGGSEGFDFLRYRNDSVTNYDSFGIGSIDYIERGGICRKSYFNNGNTFETIISMKNGTEEALGGYTALRTNGVIEEEYAWGGATVSQAKYQEKVNALLPQDQVKHTRSDNSKIYDYDGILEWLLANEPEGADPDTSAYRTEWIQKHMEYAASNKYQEQVNQGFTGALSDVFEDVKKDPLIRAYSTLDSINSIFDFDLNLTDVQDYELLLAQVLFTRSGVTSIEEMYDEYLVDALVMICEWLMTQVHITEDLDEDTVSDINRAITQLKNVSEDGSDYYLLLDELLSLFKDGKTLEFGEAFAKQFNDAGFNFGAGFSIEQAALTCQTLDQCVLYLAAGEAYCKTSDAFAEIILAMRKHIFIKSDNPVFEPYPVESALVTEQQILSRLGCGNDPLNCPFNMQTLATALEGYYIMLTDYKNGDASSMANKLAEEYIDKTFDNIMDASLDVALSLFECIPVVNTFSVIKKCFKAGQFALDKLTTIDEREYYGTMLMRAYAITYIHYLTVDNLASMDWNSLPVNVTCSLEEYQYDRAHRFDEAVAVYRAILTVASTYATEYCSVQYNFIPDHLNSYYGYPTINKNIIQLQDQMMILSYEWCHSTGLIFEITHNNHYNTEDLNLLSFKCPIQITIRDENGEIFAILNNENSTIAAGYEHYFYVSEAANGSGEYIKIAAIPKTYTVEISGTGTGSMDMFASDYSNNAVGTTWYYLNVPIEKETEGTLENNGNEAGNVALYIDGTAYDGEIVHEHTFVDNKCELCGISGGACGENLNWALYEEGVLSITGSGEMYDFKMGESPWTEYRKQITVILLPDGLTRIGNEAFRGLYKVQSVTIPESVTEIGSCAFIMTGLTSVSLPESLRIIDSGAFSDTPLKAVDIPDSVTHIGNGAFSECDYVDHIFIPASVTTIGSGPFSNCRNLTSISVDPGNPNFITDANGVLYNSEMTTLYQCPGAFSGEYVIPYGVTTLDSCAFEGCAGLTKVTIPDSVTSLPGQSTFAYCTGLTELILPDGITALNYAFAFRATSLTNVRLPKQLTVLDDAAFYDCSSLTRIIIPESVTEIGSRCFENTALNSVIFRGSAPSINETAFTGVTATAYYPGNDPSWTADTMLDYGGSLTWVPVYENETVTRIDAKKTVLNAGETLDLTAVLDPGVLVDEEIIWTLYDNGDGGGTELITENGTTAKLYAGFYLYDNVITVTAQAANDSAEPAVLEITIRQREADYTLFAGKSVTLKETDPATGKPYASKRLQWYMSTENEPYATLTSAGKLTAKKVVSKNRIIVYADIDGKPGFMRVVDIYPAVTQVDVMWEDNNPINGKTIPVDFTTQNLLFTVTAHPLDTMQNVKWSISDSEKQTYAEYETNGRVLRVFNLKRTKAGTVTVKATVDAGQKKSTTFKLQFGSFAKEVKITAASNSLQSGNSLQLSAVTVPAKPTKSGITWSLSQEDKAYASISSSGLLKAKTVYGRTEITVIATSKDGQAQAEFPVTILPANSAVLLLKCGGKNVTKDTVYVDLNGDPTITLTAERFDRLEQPSVTWTVPKSAEVLEKTDTTLTLRFLKAGTATITATGADKQKVTVKVVAAKMAQSVEISQKKTNLTEGFEVASGKTLELKATVENAKNKKVTWSLAPGDEAYAKISSSGKLTAAKNLTTMRQVTVIATAADGSGIYDEAVVSIRPIAQGVQIYSVVDGVRTFSVRSDPSRWVRSNTVYEWDMVASTRLTLSSHVYPYYAENHPRNAMQGVTWKSSSPKVASVDANGNVICHKPGSTTITATAKDGSSKKVTFKLTVVKKTTGLQLPDQQVIGGKTLALNKLVQYSPTDVTNKTLNWEIIGGTGTDYATLSSKGSLKTKKVTKPVTVTVRITATDGTHCTDTCTVTILPKS